jgi:hypothetical protein
MIMSSKLPQVLVAFAFKHEVAQDRSDVDRRYQHRAESQQNCITL